MALPFTFLAHWPQIWFTEIRLERAEIKNLASCPDFVNKYFIRVIFIVELIIQLSSLSHLKFVCLHFKLIVSQSFILVVKNLSQVRMFSRKLSTIYSRTVNCPQNWKDFYAGIFWFVWKKLFLASLSILSIKIKLNSWENIQM